ncbi:unnamed protein product [Ceutorhynchus assimilis]|uniref:G-protein coupled receptors family 2 profile 2 domain-containing protein n=1 Tax=Ceutorhynchus assimilis TaxID=467358 RepID=A0A9N9MNU1_9CUCU|nr:unnamed protein product [Ceutorhynchus assimilis]
MLVVYLFISCLVHRSYQDVIAKCCQENFEVEQSANLTLECISKNNNTRLQVWSSLNNFLKNNSDGECIDIDSSNRHFYNYIVNSSVLVTKTLIESKEIFPKCCPLNYVYNNLTHSCVGSNITQNHIENQFVKVGLPHCQIIIDKYFKNHQKAIEWKKHLNSGSYCMDKDIRNEFVVRECQEGLEICENKRCFKKCCGDGQSFVGGGTCVDTFVHGLKLDNQWYSPYIEDIEDDYELIYGAKCPKVSLFRENKIQYSIGKNGQFQFFYNFSGEFVEHNYSNLKSYCLEHATKGSVSGYHFFYCLDEKPLIAKYASTLWAKVLSCILLVLTLLVYFYLGEVKSTFGKILVNYCAAMTLFMVTLIVAHLRRNHQKLECKFRAYALIFFNMAAFAWVNIMSLDIWWTFGTPRRTIGSDQKRKDLKKFLFYFLYGWGMPLCHGLLILLFDLTTILPEPIQPYLGIYQCFLEDRNYARTVLFLIPQLLFQIFNTVLFIKTITYCIRVKNEISRMNDTNRNGRFAADKEKLGLIVKLATIMGIIWVFEVTTAFFTNMRTFNEFTKNLEIVLDTITCLQGVFIFLIFICKKKTLNALKAKLGLGERRISCSASQSSHVNGHYPMNKRQTTISLNESRI